MRCGPPTRALAAAALLVLAAAVAGCGRPPDEAWLRFLGFRDDGNSTLTVLEGNLNDGKTDSANAVFSNASVIVGVSGSGAGTGILVKSARVDYKMSGHAPPSDEYPLNIYLGPSSHTNGTATVTDTTEAQASFPLATAALKQWLINTGAFSDSSATPAVRLTADVTFFAETDEGTELEVHGSITILLYISGGGSGTVTPTVSVAATVPTATIPTATTTAVPGKFTVTRSGSTTSKLVVYYDPGGSATSGSDYEALSGSVTISAGYSTATIAVTPIIGATAGKEVTVTLTENSAYNVSGSNSEATVTIQAP